MRNIRSFVRVNLEGNEREAMIIEIGAKPFFGNDFLKGILRMNLQKYISQGFL
jgi:hypothetical protein